MKTQNLLVCLIILIFMTGSLLGQDWPQWRGANRDDIVTGFKAPKKWPQELKQLWKVTVGLGDASPVLSGGKLYVFARKDADEIIYCLDTKTGKEIWQNKYNAAVVAGPSAALHSGPRSTPVVEEGKIITFGVAGVLSCLDASNGKLIWRKENTTNLVPQLYIGMSPIIINRTVIGHIGGKGTGTIVAYDLNSGNEKWAWTGDGPCYSSPVSMALDGKIQVVFVTEKSLLGLDPSDGKLLWQVESVPQSRFYNAATPVINRETVILTGLGSGTKAYRIQKSGDKYMPEEVWNNPDLGTKYCTPVLREGFLFGVSDKRKIYCMDAQKGQTAWVDTTMHSDFASVIYCGDVMLAIPGRSELVIFNPDTKKYSQVAVLKVSDSPIYAHPVVSGNFIYIKDKESMIKYSVD